MMATAQGQYTAMEEFNTFIKANLSNNENSHHCHPNKPLETLEILKEEVEETVLSNFVSLEPSIIAPYPLNPSPMVGTQRYAKPSDLSSEITSTPLQVRDANRKISSNTLRLLRKPAPALLAPLKLFDFSRRRKSTSQVVPSTQTSSTNTSSRVPEILFNDKPFQDQEPRPTHLEVKGESWLGFKSLRTSRSLPRLRFRASVMAHDEKSDISSVISASDRPVLSESEESDELLDTQKYILPDLDKSRGSSREAFNSLPRPNRTASDLSQTSEGESFFNPYGLHRTASVYTLSRASFSNQISQLTSIKLPQASSLSSTISAIPTSQAAVKALNDVADQIRVWIRKVTEVLEGLKAEDDVEWAAAGGREGVGEVDGAINRFESLIDVYVGSIEKLQVRSDIDTLSADELNNVAHQMELIVADWTGIRESLEGVKKQVEIAMEWEVLWNKVLGEISMEEENLSRIIFEMEERRHKSSLLDTLAEPSQGLDIKELQNMVDQAPARNNFKIPGDENASKGQSQEDSNLLAVTARMQPLQTSIDFLPMRLSKFLSNAEPIFPSACEELNTRAAQLEAKFKKLESDAESLRKELGEDKWVLVFRKAGSKALKMCESVERSVAKLREGLNEAPHPAHQNNLLKRIENYEAKKEHYVPAIQQVITIIDTGVLSRLTANGEILRLQSDIQKRWAEIGSNVKTMDFALEQMNILPAQPLRDSVSTILSEQRSVTSSQGTFADTPGSSPASSVILIGQPGSDQGVNTAINNKSRQSSFTSSSTTRARRYSSLPSTNSASQPVRTPVSKSSASNLRASVTGVSSRLYQPPPPRSVSRAEKPQPAKPRWNGSTSLNDTPLGHNFKALSLTSPSPYRKELRTQRSFSHHNSSSTVPSPLGRSLHSNLPPRPPSAAPTTPASSSTIRHSHIGSVPRPQLGASQTIATLKTPNTHMTAPRSQSAYIPRTTASSIIPATPPSDRSTRHISRGSIDSSVSSTTAIRNPSISIPSSSSTVTTPIVTPSSPYPPGHTIAGAEQDGHPEEASPSSSRAASRVAGRRLSMLPVPSKVATAAANAAMSGRSTVMSGRVTPSGRASRLSKQETTTPLRPKWR